MELMKRILFVCTGNSCRSVMAEGLFKKLTEARSGKFQVTSAGISAIEGFPATPETIEAMEKEGVDVSGHRSRRLTPEMVKAADRIFVMEEIHKELILSMVPEARNKVFLLTEFSPAVSGKDTMRNVPDPIRMSESFYKNVLGVIRDCVKNIAEDCK
jgi:protein-tyrosine phosphatase